MKNTRTVFLLNKFKCSFAIGIFSTKYWINRTTSKRSQIRRVFGFHNQNTPVKLIFSLNATLFLRNGESFLWFIYFYSDVLAQLFYGHFLRSIWFSVFVRAVCPFVLFISVHNTAPFNRLRILNTIFCEKYVKSYIDHSYHQMFL